MAGFDWISSRTIDRQSDGWIEKGHDEKAGDETERRTKALSGEEIEEEERQRMMDVFPSLADDIRPEPIGGW